MCLHLPWLVSPEISCPAEALDIGLTPNVIPASDSKRCLVLWSCSVDGGGQACVGTDGHGPDVGTLVALMIPELILISTLYAM